MIKVIVKCRDHYDIDDIWNMFYDISEIPGCIMEEIKGNTEEDRKYINVEVGDIVKVVCYIDKDIDVSVDGVERGKEKDIKEILKSYSENYDFPMNYKKVKSPFDLVTL